MNNRRDGNKQLPPTATVPMPPPRPATGPDAYAPRGHNSFMSPMHEDVGRVMQNVIDLQAEVTRLRKENMDWEHRALLAEGKVEQQKQDLADVKAEHTKETMQLKHRHNDEMAVLQKELDYYKARDAVVQTKLAIGAQHFLDCMQSAEQEKKKHEGQVLEAVSEEVNRLMGEFDKNKEHG